MSVRACYRKARCELRIIRRACLAFISTGQRRWVSDRVSRVGSLQVTRLHRTHIVLVMRCAANKRASPVDFESGVAGGQRNTGYSLSTPIVIFLI